MGLSSSGYQLRVVYSERVEAMKSRSPVARGVYFVLGLLALGLVFISALPGIPTADMAFLAAFFFAKSSDRLHTWLITHPRFGPMIANFDPRTGYTTKTKITGIAMVTASFTLSVLLVQIAWVRVLLILLATSICVFIWTRQDQERESAAV